MDSQRKSLRSEIATDGQEKDSRWHPFPTAWTSNGLCVYLPKTHEEGFITWEVCSDLGCSCFLSPLGLPTFMFALQMTDGDSLLLEHCSSPSR